ATSKSVEGDSAMLGRGNSNRHATGRPAAGCENSRVGRSGASAMSRNATLASPGATSRSTIGDMRTTLLLTAVGPDRTGLVESLAQRIAAAGGNWEESRMGRLAGSFAGI